ncbi:MAG TPA: 3-oxoacyl-ACP synthase [Tissierellia bacterium]|nr:3-oxoacyl-ACP synthase [Tissierellia bacterium]
MTVVGIRSMAHYVPEQVLTSADIARMSGIPEEIIREKFGIHQIHKAPPEESVTDMGVKAAKKALGEMDPQEIDMVVYCGSEYKDYYLFNAAARIAHQVGASRAAVFEIHNLCSAGVWSLKVLKSMMIQDESLKKVLLVSSSKEGDLINYEDQDSRFMFNFGDGAAAVILERDYRRNVILESAMIADGRFSGDVSVPWIGSVNFNAFDKMPPKGHYLQVTDVQSMKERLDPVTLDNFLEVMRQAAKKSGFEKIDFLAPIFMKRSIVLHLMEELGIDEEKTYVLEEFGHCQSADSFISLIEGEKSGRLQDGDRAILVAAGTGYTWAATGIQWGEYRG